MNKTNVPVDCTLMRDDRGPNEASAGSFKDGSFRLCDTGFSKKTHLLLDRRDLFADPTFAGFKKYAHQKLNLRDFTVLMVAVEMDGSKIYDPVEEDADVRRLIREVDADKIPAVYIYPPRKRPGSLTAEDPSHL